MQEWMLFVEKLGEHCIKAVELHTEILKIAIKRKSVTCTWVKIKKMKPERD